MQPDLCTALISGQWTESGGEAGSQALRPLTGFMQLLKSLLHFDCDVCSKGEMQGTVKLYCSQLDHGTEEKSHE